MMPTEPQPPAATEPLAGPIPVRRPEYHWYHKMWAVLFITFCLEIGIFLVVFPWTPWWEGNFFSGMLPQLRGYWENTYLRGAISGLGVVNLYISFIEALRLRRFAKH
jgi:hypothetical protein